MTKIKKVQAPDGTIIKVEGPDDAPDEQFIQEGIRLYNDRRQQKTMAAPPLPGRPTPTALQPDMPKNTTMADLLVGVGPGVIAERVTGMAKDVLNNYPLFGQGYELSPQEQIGAKIFTAGSLAPAAVDLAGALPLNMKRAKANWDIVDAAAAGQVPNLSKADDIALEALQAGGKGVKTPGTGSSLPKLFSDYILQRQQSPQMNYETARAFAKTAGSKLSELEQKSTDANMKRLIGEFSDALRTANREAAAKVGMGELYDAASKEFKNAMSVQQAGAILAKWGKRAALAYGLKKGYDAFGQ